MPEVRLCDKDAEIERIKQYCSARGCAHKYWSIYCKACEVSDMIDEFESAQEVEAEPVRHGRWIEETAPDENGNVISMCNQCYCTVEHSKNIKVPYCCFCGANMLTDLPELPEKE